MASPTLTPPLLPPETTASPSFEGIAKISRDLKRTAPLLSLAEARFLVDDYYTHQDNRIRTAGQMREMVTIAEPHEVLKWKFAQDEAFENEIKKALDYYSNGFVLGRWARSQYGIGPVLAAGLLAHLDVSKVKGAGAFWRFAGLDPSVEWIGKEGGEKLLREIQAANKSADYETLIPIIAARMHCKPEALLHNALQGPGKKVLEKVTRASLLAAMAKRPWNAKLKTLCWKIGESFVKTSGREGDVYGHLVSAKKDALTIQNQALQFKDQAAQVLAECPTHAQAAIYKTGMLSPGHIFSRAKRYGVKLFLAHYFEVAWQLKHGCESPKPFIFTEAAKQLGLDHTHWLHAPNWPMKEKLPVDLPKLP